MKKFDYPNAPLSLHALEAIESMTGGLAPDDIRQQILAAPYSDDLSGLRLMANQIVEVDPCEWGACPQPKKMIGEYVEKSGFSVPKRYESLGDALGAVQQGATIVMRSEHPLEYDTFSGLLDSYRLNTEALSREDKEFIKAINSGASEEDVLFIAKHEGLTQVPIKRYLELTGKSFSDYQKEMSFSFWEYVPGRNIAVVADDAIDGRYHITSYGMDGRGGALGGIFNNGGEPFNTNDAAADSLSKDLSPHSISQLISTYEDIRSLPDFNQRQCPIMELQLGDDGTIWFLQYHKARPFRPHGDTLDPLDYPAQEGWLKAEAVRGAIGRFVMLRTAIWYPEGYKPSSDGDDASFDMHYDVGLSEFLARQRAAYFSQHSARNLYHNMADGSHELRSRWFKPNGSLTIGRAAYNQLIPEDKKDTLANLVFREDIMARFAIDVASDGLTGYVRLNPDTEQPIIGHYL